MCVFKTYLFINFFIYLFTRIYQQINPQCYRHLNKNTMHDHNNFVGNFPNIHLH